MELISVIVPVFNVENFLSKCIESIISQTYDNLEIILVDDGSTDMSSQICDEYKVKDNRVRVVHKENGGLSDARNTGVKIATGNYIGFVDGDDYIEADMYEKLFEAIQEYKAEISICGRMYISDIGSKELFTNDRIVVFSKYEALKHYLINDLIDPSVCDKLFAKRIFQNIEFPVGKLHEDLFVMYKIINAVDSIVHVGTPKYNYILRNGSITKSKFSVRNFDYIDAKSEMRDFFIDFSILKHHVDYNYFNGFIVIIDKILVSDVVDEYYGRINDYISIIRCNLIKIFLNPLIGNKEKVKILLLSINFSLYKKVILRKRDRLRYN